METKRYLTAGEFAKIVGVTKHTLFHYDKIGLFAPARRGDNDYRYYTLEQLDIFDVIASLRELDMPLEKIKVYLAERTPESLLSLLEKEETILQERIKGLRRKTKWLQQKREQLRQAVNTDVDYIGVEEYPQQYYIIRKTKSYDETSLAMEAGYLLEDCDRWGIKGLLGVGYQQNLENIAKGIYDSYEGIYMLIDKKVKGVDWSVRPQGLYLTAYHKGHWDSLEEAYRRMMEYARVHSLKPTGETYEDYILDGLAKQSQEDYITRIQFRCLREDEVKDKGMSTHF